MTRPIAGTDVVRRHLLTYVEDLRRRGERTAFIWREGVRWQRRTRAELRLRIGACAGRLAAAGVRRGDHVMIQGPDGADWVEALFGVLAAGGVVVPLEAANGVVFTARVAQACGARLLVAPAGTRPPDGVTLLPLGSWDGASPASPVFQPAAPVFEPAPDDRAEVLFTSGTTGEPKGVILTHGNVVSDFAPLERIYRRYARAIDLLGELRFVTTLPLSHMFGQAINVFVPIAMGLSIVFVPPRPREVLEAARRHRIWGLFSVPRLLDLLADEVRRTLRHQGCLERYERRQGRIGRWPFYLQAFAFPRAVRLLGWRFRLIVSGGAALPPRVQQFWERFGLLVIQGYGLTETAPVVTLSNPFERHSGGVGRPLGNQEVRLGPNGEVLVRGPNVTPGYLGQQGNHADAEGWFPTGDVGEFDDRGRLMIRGRLKDVIVTPEGENVHPIDVESAFQGVAGLREVAVLGLPTPRGESVHAVLILDGAGRDPQEIVSEANARLLARQRVRGFTIWEAADYPRTPTGKVALRAAILKEAGVAAGSGAAADGGGTAGDPASSGALPSVAAAPADVRRILAGIARVRMEDLKDGTRLVEGLGLGSLDLVELTVAVEEEFGVGLPEDVLAGATVGDLERIVVAGLQGEAAPAAVPSRPAVVSPPAAAGALQPAADVTGAPLAPTGAPAARSGAPPAAAAAGRPGARGALRMPRWTRGAAVHALRRLLEETAYRAVVLVFARPRVEGLEHLRGIDPPFLFVGNHHSYIDSGLFKTVLPRPLRGRIAPGMTTRYHRVYFGETEGGRARYLKEWFQVKLVEFLFFAWPLPETAGVRNSLAYAGELADAGVSLLIFPEGRHVPEGTIEPFRKGIGIFARELRLPVVPVFVEGTGRVLPDEVYFPRFGRTRLVLGAPLTIPPDLDATEATRRIEAAVRALGR